MTESDTIPLSAKLEDQWKKLIETYNPSAKVVAEKWSVPKQSGCSCN
jgi:hypothetical protein